MRRENGSVIGVDNTPTTSVASGVWSLFEQARYQKEGVWPQFVAGEPYFNYTTLLLHGDGTNGAQNNTFLDSSTNNFTITRNGNTTQGTFSPFSQDDGEWSAYFDGSGDYLTLADNAAFDVGSGDFTVECWINHSFTGARKFILGQSNSAGQNTSISFSLYKTSANKISFDVFVGGTQYAAVSTSDAPLNEFVHIAGVRDGGTTRLYINGVQAATNASLSTQTINNSSELFGIGCLGGYISDTWSGYISNVRLVKGTCLYPSGTTFTPSTTPLTAISGTQLLTCQSNRFKDNSANAFAITVNGNTSIQPFSPFAPSAAYDAATNGGSGYFDGSGDYLTLPSDAAFAAGTGDFTLEGWLYTSDTTLAEGGSSQSMCNIGGIRLSLNSSTGALSYRIGSSTGVNGSEVAQQDAWNHFVIVRSGSTLSTFLNGVISSTETNTTNLTTQSCLIGANTTTTGRWLGYLASIRFVKGTAVYDPTQTTLTVPTAPLTAVSGTSLLCNFTNAGILDNTGRNDLETVGNAQISTSVKKFGTGSLAFDGSGDYLQMSQGFTLGAGNFTVEAWIYPTVANQKPEVWQRGGLISDFAVSTNFNAADAGIILGEFVNAGSGYSATAGSTALTQNAWNHVAWVRSGSTVTMYLNGTSVGTVSNSSDTQSLGRIGAFAAATYDFSGYIDDLRITKGVARYTSNFTPPTAAFEDQ